MPFLGGNKKEIRKNKGKPHSSVGQALDLSRFVSHVYTAKRTPPLTIESGIQRHNRRQISEPYHKSQAPRNKEKSIASHSAVSEHFQGKPCNRSSSLNLHTVLGGESVWHPCLPARVPCSHLKIRCLSGRRQTRTRERLKSVVSAPQFLSSIGSRVV